MADHYLCVHGHFYQPPRGNPFAADDIPVEAGAEPYRNFNEKITAECYAPNADLGNFELMSFNLGATLAHWLEIHAPQTYAKIVAAEQAQHAQWGVGNALAQPAHHTILPLCRKRDKRVQVMWGLMSFEHRFGHQAGGMWLPEMAVDLETLQVLHDAGVKFTILAQSQLKGSNDGAGPYWVKLPSGDRIAVYARDDWHSNQLSFNINSLGGAGRWARNTLSPLRKTYPRFLLIATDGETFGHHHLGEEHFLHWLLAFEANSVGFEVTTLGRDLRDNEPVGEIEINEYTAWSCWHGLNRWSNGCECTPGDSRWKPALRRAFDNLAAWVDEGYLAFTRGLSVDPWQLRIDYFRVRLGQLSDSEFLRDAGLSALPAGKAQGLLSLLLAQFYCQRMYVSSTFYFEDLDRPEPRYGIANALRATLLAGEATGASYVDAFHQDLKLAVSNKNGQTGAQVLDEVLVWARDAGIKAAAEVEARD
jgi:alpha-amylase/alpha-mannosidase (GH57 family)